MNGPLNDYDIIKLKLLDNPTVDMVSQQCLTTYFQELESTSTILRCLKKRPLFQNFLVWAIFRLVIDATNLNSEAYLCKVRTYVSSRLEIARDELFDILIKIMTTKK